MHGRKELWPYYTTCRALPGSFTEVRERVSERGREGGSKGGGDIATLIILLPL